MSHDATNWAVRQRGLPATTKVVLWHLADRHNKDTDRCDPSQELLAADVELSRSALNAHLKRLEEVGLIVRHQRRDPRTRRQLSTFYTFNFELIHKSGVSAEPCPESGHGTVSGSEAEPCPDSRPSRVLPAGHKPGIEPGIEPFEKDARAGDSDPVEGSAPVPHADLLDQVLTMHPTAAHDDQEEIERRWRRLTPEERREVVAELPGWIAAKPAGRQVILGLPKVLAQKPWRKMAGHTPEARAEREEAARHRVPGWSRSWFYLLLWSIEASEPALAAHADISRRGEPLAAQGDRVAAFLRQRIDWAERYGKGGAWRIEDDVDRDRLDQLAGEQLAQVPADSETAAAFRARLACLGLRIETPDEDAGWWYWLKRSGEALPDPRTAGQESAA